MSFASAGLGEVLTYSCNEEMRFITYVAATTLIVGCKFSEENKRWALTLDKRNRPIVDCISLTADAFFAAAIAMNCRKSIIDHMFLCSQGRMLNHYDKKE